MYTNILDRPLIHWILQLGGGGDDNTAVHVIVSLRTSVAIVYASTKF